MHKTAIDKPTTPVKLTWYVVLMVGVLYPLLFALSNQQFTLIGYLSDIILNSTLLSLMVWLSYGISRLMDNLPPLHRKHFLRYIAEFGSVLVVIYYLLKGMYYVLVVKTNNLTGDWQDWQYRYFIGLNLEIAAFIYLFQLGLGFYRVSQQKAAEAQRIEKEFAHVRLQALHNQLNPHFLFNSLSVLSSLVHMNAELSEKFIVQLSVAYRYILEQKDIEWVKLSSELEFLEAYFFLLQIRFDQKIQLHHHIELDTEAYKLPPLTLQLLVENAVKHNKMSSAQPLVINLYNEGEALVIENTINIRTQAEKSTGIGLGNIRKRYSFLTRKEVQITQTGSHFKVSIPLLIVKET
jgi:two-component system, LytTR family, sensor kinase